MDKVDLFEHLLHYGADLDELEAIDQKATWDAFERVYGGWPSGKGQQAYDYWSPVITWTNTSDHAG